MEKIWTSSFVKMTSGMLLLFTGFYLTLTVMPLFVKEIGGTEAQVGLVAGAFALAGARSDRSHSVPGRSRPAAGKLSDRFGESYVIVPALTVTAAALVVLSVADGLAGVIVSAVIYGIGFGAAQPAMQAANLRLAPPDKRGVANASYMTAFDLSIGIGFGAIGLGWVSHYAGYDVLFLVCALSVAVSAVVCLAAVRQRLAAVRASEAA